MSKEFEEANKLFNALNTPKGCPTSRIDSEDYEYEDEEDDDDFEDDDLEEDISSNYEPKSDLEKGIAMMNALENSTSERIPLTREMKALISSFK